MTDLFNDVRSTQLGKDVEQFLKDPLNICRMETAIYFERPPVEALSPVLLEKYGEKVKEDRMKQFVGLVVSETLKPLGYEVKSYGIIIERGYFSQGATYKKI